MSEAPKLVCTRQQTEDEKNTVKRLWEEVRGKHKLSEIPTGALWHELVGREGVKYFEEIEKRSYAEIFINGKKVFKIIGGPFGIITDDC